MKKTVTLLILLCFINIAAAVPPSPDNPCWKTGNCPKDLDQVGLTTSVVRKPSIIENIIGFFAPSVIIANDTIGANGTQNVLFIPVKFNDTENSTTIASLETKYQNLSLYFEENSWNQLTLNITFAQQWYQLPKNMSYYGEDYLIWKDYNMSDYFIDAINVSDNDVDFTQYDHLLILHAGGDQAETGNTSHIWSARYRGLALDTNDGVLVNTSITISESDPLGVIAHEFAHDIGALDLYDISSGNPVVWNWSLMDQGSWANPPSHLDAWHKWAIMNWTTPTIIDDDSSAIIDIYAIENNASLVKVPIAGTQEYFLIEYRNKSGFDAALPESGILIWHINDTIINTYDNDNSVNAHSPPGVIPEDQNSSVSYMYDAAYQQGDQDFTPTSGPNSSRNDDVASNISIFNFVDNGAYYTVSINNNVQELVITMTSPANRTYATTNISLNYTTTQQPDSCWYRLNAGGNITITGNTTFLASDNQQNNIQLFCNDTEGSVKNSSLVYFTVDTSSPSIVLSSPSNTTYATDNISLNYTVSDNMVLDSCWYTDVNGSDTSLTNCQNTTFIANQGQNNISVYVNDTAGNVNFSQVFFTVDSIAPTVSFVSPTPNNVTINVSYAYINVTVSEVPDTVNLEWNGTNESMSGSGTLWYKNKTNLFNGNYTFKVYVNDSVNNTDVTETRWVVIQAPLAVNIEIPENTTYNYIPSLNYTISGISIDECWYTLDNGKTNTTLINCTGQDNIGSEGFNTLTVYINDTLGNQNSSTVSFTIDTVKPTVTNVSTITPITQNNQTNITATVNDDNVIDNVVAEIMYPDGHKTNYTMTNVSNDTYNLSFTNTSAVGVYNVTVFANDTANNINNTETTTFEVKDVINPTVSIQSPLNRTYNYTPSLNYTISDNTAIDKCWYSNATDTNVSLENCENTTINVIEGINTLVIWVNDTSDNRNYSSVNFSLDTTPPFVTIISPAAGNKKGDVVINVSVMDASGISTVSYRIENSTWNGTWVSMVNTSTEYWNVTLNTTSLNDGSYVIRIRANDTLNNTNSSETVDIIVDNTLPTVLYSTVLSVTNSSAILTWYTDENTTGIVEYGLNTSYGTTAANSTESDYHTIFLSDLNESTTYHYRINSTDLAGNNVTSMDYTFTTATVYTNQTVNVTENQVLEINTTNNITVSILSNQNVTNATLNLTYSPDYLTNTTLNATKFKFVNITTDDTLKSNLIYLFIKIFYNDTELSESGVEESSLKMYYFNESSDNWLELNSSTMSWVNDTGVDTSDNYVWANLTNLSIYAIGGLLENGQVCTDNINCSSNNCAEDYNGDGKWCAPSGSCAHNGTVYDNGESICQSGVKWSCTSGNWTSETCDNGCSGGECITTTTTTSGGGGGDGGATSPATKKSWVFNKMSPNTTINMDINGSVFGLNKLAIGVKNQTGEVKISVSKLTEKPVSVSQNISDKVFTYLEIAATGDLDSSNIDSIKLWFQVEKTWLTNNNYSSAILYRYVDVWEALPTLKTGDDATYVYYEAESTGLSYFAIAGTGEVSTTTTLNTTTTTVNQTNLTTTVPTSTVPTTIVTAPNMPSKFDNKIIGLVLMVVSIVVLFTTNVKIHCGMMMKRVKSIEIVSRIWLCKNKACKKDIREGRTVFYLKNILGILLLIMGLGLLFL
jgi:M6 family metalloprotease-like protein/PGF-pre-PGF domain-containing protein